MPAGIQDTCKRPYLNIRIFFAHILGIQTFDFYFEVTGSLPVLRILQVGDPQQLASLNTHCVLCQRHPGYHGAQNSEGGYSDILVMPTDDYEQGWLPLITGDGGLGTTLWKMTFSVGVVTREEVVIIMPAGESLTQRSGMRNDESDISKSPRNTQM